MRQKPAKVRRGACGTTSGERRGRGSLRSPQRRMPPRRASAVLAFPTGSLGGSGPFSPDAFKIIARAKADFCGYVPVLASALVAVGSGDGPEHLLSGRQGGPKGCDRTGRPGSPLDESPPRPRPCQCGGQYQWCVHQVPTVVSGTAPSQGGGQRERPPRPRWRAWYPPLMPGLERHTAAGARRSETKLDGCATSRSPTRSSSAAADSRQWHPRRAGRREWRGLLYRRRGPGRRRQRPLAGR